MILSVTQLSMSELSQCIPIKFFSLYLHILSCISWLVSYLSVFLLMHQ